MNGVDVGQNLGTTRSRGHNFPRCLRVFTAAGVKVERRVSGMQMCRDAFGGSELLDEDTDKSRDESRHVPVTKPSACFHTRTEAGLVTPNV